MESVVDVVVSWVSPVDLCDVFGPQTQRHVDEIDELPDLCGNDGPALNFILYFITGGQLHGQPGSDEQRRLSRDFRYPECGCDEPVGGSTSRDGGRI